MSIRLYTGEYLISPVPVHYGLNWCTHACFYCFANLNQPHRRAENTDLVRLAKWFRDGAGPLEYWYLSRGYPMLVSNDSDPCAKSNRESFLALHELAARHGIALAYQTKAGSDEVERLILEGRRTLIYVTVTSDDDDLLRRIEPGAPTWQHRLDFIRRAVSAGHFVVVGMNPLVPGWWLDLQAALDALHAAGAAHIWHGDLHFSRFQIDAMPANTRQAQAEWVRYGLKKTKPDAAISDAALAYAASLGFNIFEGVAGTKTGFWQPYFDLGYPFMPTLDGLYSRLDELGQSQPVVFDFEAFHAWADTGAPGDRSIYREYLTGYGRSIRNDGIKAEARSLRDVHEWEWRWLDYQTRMRTRELHLAATGLDTDQPEIVVDEAGRPLMVYTHAGSDEIVYPIESAAYLRSIRNHR